MIQTPTSSPRLLQLLQQGLARLAQAESEAGLIRVLDDLLQQFPGIACAMLTVVDHLAVAASPEAATSASRTWLLALPAGSGLAARAALRPMPPLEFPIRPGSSGMLCVYSDPARPRASSVDGALLDSLRIVTLTFGAHLARLTPATGALPMAAVGSGGISDEPLPPRIGERPFLPVSGERSVPAAAPDRLDRRVFMQRVDAHLQATACLEAALLRVDVGAPGRCEYSDCSTHCRYPDRHSLIEHLASALPPELPMAGLRPGEFAVLLAPGLLGPDAPHTDLARLEDSVRAEIARELAEAGLEPRLSTALWPRDGVDAAGLLRFSRAHPQEMPKGEADAAASSAERVSMQSELQALVTGGRLSTEMRVVYQPQVGLADMRLCGVEALLRWRSPRFGEVAPAVFMPLLEESGLIVQVGEWVVREACRQVRRWAEQGVRVRRLALNLSAGQLRAPATARALEAVLLETGLMAWCQLEVEVTESTLMSDTDSVIDQLLALKGLGVGVAVDDFGRGTCALGWLESFPISGIKVDPLFLGELDSNPDHAQLARAMFDLGRALKLRVSAEGVETASQLAFIRSNGCEEAQGYYFARPLEAEHFLVSTSQSFH